MDKKTIVSKTILFVAIVGFIILFQSVFGSENTLVGVTVITAALMFLERDLTPNLLKYFFMFLGINLMQGVLSFLANGNIYIGIIGTFISMFITGYMFTYSLKSPMYVAFGLQYLFMLYAPVTIEQLPIRLAALASGAVLVIVFQLIANKNRLSKISKNKLPKVVEELSNKISSMINFSYNKENDKEIISNIKEIRKAILESRESHFHTTLEGKINLNLTIGIERINILIDRIYNELTLKEDSIGEKEKEFFLLLKEIVDSISLCRGNREEARSEIKRIKDFLNKYKGNVKNPIENISSINMREMLENLDFIEHNISEVVDVEEKEYKKVVRKTSIPEKFKSSFVMRRNLSIKSVQFSYAFRSALLITMGYFIVKYYNLEDGKWLVFTLFSIVQPYLQDATIKSLHRIKGTIIGIIAFLIIFSIIKDPTQRSLIIMLVGYINSYQKTYDKQMIFTTISALGVAAVVGDPNILALDRLVYVVFGIVIALIANKLILPYTIEDSTKNLMKIYSDIFSMIHKEIELAKVGKGNIQKVRNLVMQTSLIEDRLYINSRIHDEKTKEEIETAIESHRVEINDLYDEYLGAHGKAK